MRNKLSRQDFVLLFIGYWVLYGYPTVTEDNLYTLFYYYFQTISDTQARNILGELHLKGYLHRKRKEKEKDEDTNKTRRGPRGFVYNITLKGITRYNVFVGKGYRIWEDQPLRQWDEEDIERYRSNGYIRKVNLPRRIRPWFSE